MDFEEQVISYPPVHPGTDRTFIRFYSGGGDLDAMFYAAGSESRPQRVFVTDETVSSLDAVRPFVSGFHGDGLPVAGFVGTRGSDVLVVLGAGEPFKTIGSVLSVVKAALDHNAQRSAVFVGIGGGVVTDMTAFAASIFKRGARCELVPTTLLSMVDAAVGGKTGCDFDTYKNMIGSFFPAQKVHVCPAFIGSLPFREYRSGMAEVVKTALLYSPGLFGKLEGCPQILEDRSHPLVGEAIRVCVGAKAGVVEQDLTEKGIRMQLNLGHTFAHALETKAGLGVVTHGDAVAWGMARAAALSRAVGLCSDEYVRRVGKCLSSFGWETGPVHSALAEQCGKGADVARILFDAMKKDKKNSSSNVRFVLQEDVGKTVVAEVDESTVCSVLRQNGA